MRSTARSSGKLQLELYAAVQDLLLDRIVWFLRNVDLTQGLAAVVEHYRTGIDEMAGALATALPPEEAAARDARMAALIQAGVGEALARRLADLPLLAAAPDVILVADRTTKPVASGGGDLFCRRRVLQARSHRRARRATSRSPTISTGSRSTARSIRSAQQSAVLPPRWWSTAPPVVRRWTPGRPRAATRSTASAPPSTRSPARA